MEYLDESGLQAFLSSLYNSLNINSNSEEELQFDYNVFFDGVKMTGDFILESDTNHPGFYIVKNIKVVSTE